MRAVVLAAGDGGRLHQHTLRMPKPLVPVSGRPLIEYTLDALVAARVSEAVVVTGYRAAQLESAVEAACRGRLPVTFVFNPAFQRGASLSLRAAREACAGEPFLLLMADHLLSAPILEALLAAYAPGGPSLVAVDRSEWPEDYAREATRVRLLPGAAAVSAIGKDITPWDALDTGAFLLTPDAWRAVDSAPEDTELGAVYMQLVRESALRAVDVTGASWYDVDTAADLEAANRLLAASGAR